MYEWLEATLSRLSEGVGDDPALYRLEDLDIDHFLDLAGVAAHDGGHKTNAPILSYYLGVAHGRHPELGLNELIALVAPQLYEADEESHAGGAPVSVVA
ncbi:MAG: DUF6457 domain-containing protein [Actinomycetes bacterium]